jgi:predicted 2-oxoglutarate/Fe(II)-dependent dioxygenase YbiX
MSVQNREPLLVEAELLDQAERVWQRRLMRDGADATTHTALAQVYRKQGKLEDATTLYRHAMRLDPTNGETAYMLSVLSGAEVPDPPSGFRPAPFVLLKNFLPRDFHETLMPFVLSVREQLVRTKAADGEYRPENRETLDLPGEWDIKKRFGRLLRAEIPGVLSRLHVAPFDIAKLEVKIRAYLDGHFFRFHMDCPKDMPDLANRKVSYVYFFHKHPRGYSGGDLILFDSDIERDLFTTKSFTRIVPENNTLVIFPSPYYHCVIPVSCPSQQFEDSRFVINGHVSSVTATTTADKTGTAIQAEQPLGAAAGD